MVSATTNFNQIYVNFYYTLLQMLYIVCCNSYFGWQCDKKWRKITVIQFTKEFIVFEFSFGVEKILNGLNIKWVFNVHRWKKHHEQGVHVKGEIKNGSEFFEQKVGVRLWI